MPLYNRAMDLKLAMPIPPHVFNAPPDNGVERFTYERRVNRVIRSLVTEHGHKRIEPYDGPPPAASARVARVARTAGFEVIERTTIEGHVVEGLHNDRGVGFRAYWKRGKADGATWHVRGRDMYQLVDDPRPLGFSKVTRVGLVGKRSPGTPRVHLKLISSQRGMSINITELEKRIKS